MGDDTLYSGTVAAATEGYLFGVPAIAFSLVSRDWQHLDVAARVARKVIEQVLAQAHEVSQHVGAHANDRPWLLNVNIPARADADAAPWQVTRLGRRHASLPAVPQHNPRGDLFYWIGAAGEARQEGEGTDFHAVAEGTVSITPLQVDMTHHQALSAWRSQLAT